MTSSARIPLTVIGGFLGAGKTTLLNHMLTGAQARRVAVLVNDFGALNIDAALVSSQDANTIALTNGCVCCQIGDDLTAALITVLEAPRPFDAIFIEASGVSDPWRIAQVGLADPGLALEAVIVLLDASAALAQAADPLLFDTLARQLRSADLIVVNKTDLLAPDELPRVREWLTGIASDTPTFETVRAELPPPLLLGLTVPPRGAADGDAPGHGEPGHLCDAPCNAQAPSHPQHHDDPLGHDHGALFDTWVHRPAGPLQAHALRALLRQMPAGVLRLKGLLWTDEHEMAEIQFAGKHGSLRAAGAGTRQVVGIVAIGLKGRLPAAELDVAFAAAMVA